MLNPLQLSLIRNDGTKRKIIIEPVLEKRENGLSNTGVYKIYKDAFGDESVLFTEPLETAEPNNDLPDSNNPDYLGELVVDNESNWNYKGDLLSANEQEQVAKHILIQS